MYGIIIILFISTSLTYAEGFGTLPGSNIISPPKSSSTMADDVVKKTVHSGDEVKADAGVDTNGREYKAGNAAAQGNTGKGMAIATGSALMAQAIPMLASIIPSVRAAGAILMAKAGLEFAQAGADASSAAKNNAQKDLLTNQNNDSLGSQSTADQAKESMNNPALDKFLGERGINSDDFKNKLANGELTDPESIKAAIGDNSSYSAGDIAKAEGLAGGALNQVLGTPDGKQVSKSVDMSEGNPQNPNSPSGSGDGVSSYALNTTGLDPKNVSALGMTDGGSSTKSAEAGKFLLTNNGSQTEGTNADAASFNGSGFLSGILGKSSSMQEIAKHLPSVIRGTLEQVGILVPSTKQHIFQLAHRNYRSFGKWRKGVRVAMANNSAQ